MAAPWISLGKESRASQPKVDPVRAEVKREERRGEDPPDEGGSRKEDREELLELNGKKVTLRQYIKMRRFHFLHHYAGVNDPLSESLRSVFRDEGMKLTVTSCEKRDGVDLLAGQPFTGQCDQAKQEHWDGFHSGFPCTTFSRLRWRKMEGYPGPVRSKEFPYGLPDLSAHRQRECDDGTLHAARSAYLGDLILESRKQDRIKPVVTFENPPPSDVEGHLSAWELEEVSSVVVKHNMTEADFPTCIYQRDKYKGQRIFKPQKFRGTLLGLSTLSGTCDCGVGNHVPVVGKEASEASGEYPKALCNKYANLVLQHFKKMATMEFYQKRELALKEEVSKLKEGDKSEGSRRSTHEETTSRDKHKRKRPEDRMITPTDVDKTATTKVKPKPKDENKEEYTYEYESEEEESASGDPPVSTKGEAGFTTPPRTRPAPGSPPAPPSKKAKREAEEDWKGGSGDYGMLKESRAKARDPSRLNFVGGMKNPAEVVQGRPTAMTLGIRIFAAWERFTKSHPEALETAATYGTKDCEMSDRTVEQWRGELRKLVGSRGKTAISLKSKWQFQSPLQADLFEAWTRKAGDPDTDLTEWISDGAPLGINREIPQKGIFPPNDREDEPEVIADSLSQLSRGAITNYTSVGENRADAKIEVDRLLKKGIVMKVTRRELEQNFSQGTISKLALLIKERPDKSKKRRLIIDLRRSGGNSKAKLREKLVLPRMLDCIEMLREMYRLHQSTTVEEDRALWRRELLLIDVSDAFPHLAVNAKELEHCITPGVEEGDEGSSFLLFRALLFGFKTAPLLWSRVAAWVARQLQACVPLSEGRHQVYLDDSVWVLQGSLLRRNLILSFILHSMRALGLDISLSKGERGDHVTWAGVDFKFEGKSDLLLTLPEKFMSELQEKLTAWQSAGMASLKDLRAVTGRISWLTGALPRARWILRVFYSVLTERENEVASGIEEKRRSKRADNRSKEHLFPVRRLERARLAMLEFLKVTKARPTRKLSLKPRSNAAVTITTDASPEGLGATLVINGQLIDVLHSKVTEADAKDLGFELGASSSQGIVEALALVVALDKWGGKLHNFNVELQVQSDSVTALSVARKLSSAGPALNCLGATLAILLEKYGVEQVKLQHIPGVANVVADYLSRPSTWSSSQRPPSLEGKEFSIARPRTGDFYPVPVPGGNRTCGEHPLWMVSQDHGSPGCKNKGTTGGCFTTS